LFEIVVFAYQNNCERLKEFIFAFFGANYGQGYFTKLKNSIKWTNFKADNRELADIIEADVYGKM
jgi:hypothetical protein